MAIRKFQRSFGGGATVYTCRVCKRKTRNTGDEGSTGNCRQCFDLAGIDNHINDNLGHDFANPEAVADFQSYAVEIEAAIAEILAKGGDASDWTTAGASYVADWRIAMANPTPAPPPSTPAPVAADSSNAEWLTINALRLAAARWREDAGFAPSLADQFNGQAVAALALADQIEAGTVRVAVASAR